jgi:deazaflavin-dependent oxidoreductase (nitroreductase family)
VQLIARAVPVAARNPVPPDQRLLGGRFIAGTPILLLTTTGRRTGKRRTPLAYVREGDPYVLCASNGGPPTQPGWYHNLQATSRAQIQVGAEHLSVTARTADPSRARPAVPRFVEMYKGYAAQEDKTGRQIPLVLLTLARPNSTA